MNLSSRSSALTLGTLALAGMLALAGWAAVSVQSGDATVTFGDPARDGTASVTVEVKYEDANGKQQKATLTGSTDVTDATTPTQKKEALQAKLQTDIDNKEVGGEPLLEISGGTTSGSTLVITPNSTTAAQNVSIKAVSNNDRKTGEKDHVSAPSVSETAIAEILAEGDITGLAGVGTTPTFAVVTPQGEVSVTLTGSMEKIELLWQLQAGLQAQGAIAIVDQRRLALLVVLDGDSFGWIAAGCTDNGLTSVCKVMVP